MLTTKLGHCLLDEYELSRLKAYYWSTGVLTGSGISLLAVWLVRTYG